MRGQSRTVRTFPRIQFEALRSSLRWLSL
jgi:hypothetical protein